MTTGFDYLLTSRSYQLPMPNESEETRREERIPASLPVKTHMGVCLSRDISASAVFIESSSSFNIGDEVKFEIEFDSPSGKLIFKCSGGVVRVEDREGKFGAAVKVIESVMESSEFSILTDSIKVLSLACKSVGHSR